MQRWIVVPERIDVILSPRWWRITRYRRGFILAISGQFAVDGTVLVNHFRFGPPCADKAA